MFGLQPKYNQKPPSGLRPHLSHPQLRGCIAFLPLFDRTGSGSLHDPFGLYTGGSFTNTPEWITSEQGIALKFDEGDSSEYWSKASVAHGIGSGDYSITVLARVDTTDTYNAVWANGTFSPGLYLRTSGGSGLWGIYDGGDVNANTIPTIGIWYMFGYSRSGTTISFYLDGVADGTGTHSGSLATATQQLGRDGSSYGRNSMAQFRLYNRALSAVEHRQIALHPWAMYSRPLPVWITTAAAPGGWSKKIDGVSTYTKIDGVTAASGITKVNGVSA